MKKSELRKLIRTVLKENAIDKNLRTNPLLNEALLNEAPKRKYKYCRGNEGDFGGHCQQESCPDCGNCTCYEITFPMPEMDRDKSQVGSSVPGLPNFNNLPTIDTSPSGMKKIEEARGCKPRERTLTENVNLAHKYGFNWVTEASWEEDKILLQERGKLGMCAWLGMSGTAGPMSVHCDTTCFTANDCKDQTGSYGSPCGCDKKKGKKRPVEPNKGDFLPDPIKPDKLDRIDFDKNMPS